MAVVAKRTDPKVSGSWRVPVSALVNWSCPPLALGAVGAASAAGLVDATSAAVAMTFLGAAVVARGAVRMGMHAGLGSSVDIADTRTCLEPSEVLAGHTSLVRAGHDFAAKPPMLESLTEGCDIWGDMVAACGQLPSDPILLRTRVSHDEIRREKRFPSVNASRSNARTHLTVDTVQIPECCRALGGWRSSSRLDEVVRLDLDLVVGRATDAGSVGRGSMNVVMRKLQGVGAVDVVVETPADAADERCWTAEDAGGERAADLAAGDADDAIG